MVSVCWPFKWNEPKETDYDPVLYWERYEASVSGGSSNSTSQTISPRNSPTRQLDSDEEFDF